MTNFLFDAMDIPAACRLGRRVYKKLFFENAALSSADKNTFQDDIDTIYWQYTLKPSTIQILPFEDSDREYLEIAFLQINLRANRRYLRLAELIHRAIPYPLLLAFTYGDQLAATTADTRINRADSNRIVVETTYTTDWFTPTALTPAQTDFLADFRVPNFSHVHVYAFYQDMVRRMVALNRAGRTGRYTLETTAGVSIADQVARLNKIAQLELEEKEIRNKLKKERHPGKKVDLNVRVRQIRDQIATLQADL